MASGEAGAERLGEMETAPPARVSGLSEKRTPTAAETAMLDTVIEEAYTQLEDGGHLGGQAVVS